MATASFGIACARDAVVAWYAPVHSAYISVQLPSLPGVVPSSIRGRVGRRSRHGFLVVLRAVRFGMGDRRYVAKTNRAPLGSRHGEALVRPHRAEGSESTRGAVTEQRQSSPKAHIDRRALFAQGRVEARASFSWHRALT